MRPQHFERPKFVFCFCLGSVCVGRLGALSTCCAACVLSGGRPLSFSPWLGHVCPRRTNFLVWWQAPSRQRCFLCVGSSACLSVSEPEPQGRFLGLQPEAQSPRPQLLCVHCHACLLITSRCLESRTCLLFSWLVEIVMLLTSGPRQTLKCSACPELRSVPGCLPVLANVTGFIFRLHCIFVFAVGKLRDLLCLSFPLCCLSG